MNVKVELYVFVFSNLVRLDICFEFRIVKNFVCFFEVGVGWFVGDGRRLIIV